MALGSETLLFSGLCRYFTACDIILKLYSSAKRIFKESLKTVVLF